MTTAAMGRLAWVLLIRTFLWLSVDSCSRGDGPCSVGADGDAGFVLATVPPHLLLAFLFRWFHLGLTVEL